MVKKVLLAAAVLATIDVLGPATAVARAPVVFRARRDRTDLHPLAVAIKQ
jgi:hypothetical protein